MQKEEAYKTLKPWFISDVSIEAIDLFEKYIKRAFIAGWNMHEKTHLANFSNRGILNKNPRRKNTKQITFTNKADSICR